MKWYKPWTWFQPAADRIQSLKTPQLIKTLGDILPKEINVLMVNYITKLLTRIRVEGVNKWNIDNVAPEITKEANKYVDTLIENQKWMAGIK